MYKNLAIVVCAFVCLSFTKPELNSVVVIPSLEDATVLIDGVVVGSGTQDIPIEKGDCFTITVEKEGYMSQEKDICFNKKRKKDITFNAKLIEDDSYTGSSETEFTNKKLKILVKNTTHEKVWQSMSNKVGQYFPDLNVYDAKGELSSVWVVQAFTYKTIRTRINIKLTQQEPLQYEMWLDSEISDTYCEDVRNEELFTDYNRVSNYFFSLIPELNAIATAKQAFASNVTGE